MRCVSVRKSILFQTNVFLAEKMAGFLCFVCHAGVYCSDSYTKDFRRNTGPHKPTVGAPPALNGFFKDEFSAAAWR